MTPFALGLVLASAAVHALWSAMIKQSGDPVAFNWLQMAPGLLIVGVLLALLPELRGALGEVDPDFWRWALAASLCHGLYMLWMGRALAEADLSLVYPIARSTPAFLPFAAAPLLGERLTTSGAAGIAIVVAGMWLVQTSGQLRLAALLRADVRFAWLTLLATVGYAITDKGAMLALDAADWPTAVPRAVFYALLTMLGGSLVMTPALLARRGGAQRLMASLRAEGSRAAVALAISLFGYSLILEALRSAPASYVVAVRQTSVLFAVALAALWLGERPDRARIAGACIIVAGVALVGFGG